MKHHHPSVHFDTESIEQGHTKSLPESIVNSNPGQTYTTFIRIKREKSLGEIASRNNKQT